MRSRASSWTRCRRAGEGNFVDLVAAPHPLRMICELLGVGRGARGDRLCRSRRERSRTKTRTSRTMKISFEEVRGVLFRAARVAQEVTSRGPGERDRQCLDRREPACPDRGDVSRPRPGHCRSRHDGERDQRRAPRVDPQPGGARQAAGATGTDQDRGRRDRPLRDAHDELPSRRDRGHHASGRPDRQGAGRLHQFRVCQS